MKQQFKFNLIFLEVDSEKHMLSEVGLFNHP